MPKLQTQLRTYAHLINLAASVIGMSATLISLGASAEPSSINVNLKGLRSQKGQVIVCLWRQQDKGFPLCSVKASFRSLTAKATASALDVKFQNVPPGDYAISAFHDENQNTTLDRGWMGRPEEGIAFSNMHQGQRGRPSFETAKFTLNGQQTNSLSLIYFSK